MRLPHLFVLAIALVALMSCDDETSTLGVDMMPSTDIITKKYQTYDVTTESYAVGDAVLARTSLSYLGRFTDPETGTTIKSDFMSQFHCDESFSLPTVINNECIQMDLRLFVKEFVGDSLATFKLSVYELNKQLDPNADYYTNIVPEEYYDKNAKPIATKWFTLSDRTLTDSARWASGYNNNIRVSLPVDLGTTIIRDYQENPEHFKNTVNWLNSGNPCSKGLYFKLESGDGAMAYIDVVQLNLSFRYYDNEYKKDTIGMCSFAATDAVVEATRFENSNLEKLLEDHGATYLKSPAGIFTMATIPAEQINVNDTIHSAKLTLTRFFENYQVNDSKESYLATFNSATNSYIFSNLAHLVTIMAHEKAEGKASENWNKVLIIPVETTSDTSGKIVKLNHDFSMSSARLVGGEANKLQLEVIYSKF